MADIVREGSEQGQGRYLSLHDPPAISPSPTAGPSSPKQPVSRSRAKRRFSDESASVAGALGGGVLRVDTARTASARARAVWC